MEGDPPGQALVEDARQQQLKEEGGEATASAGDQLCCVWSLLLCTREKLHSATQELEQLRQQQAKEMREVENYVGHVRTLTEGRDALATKLEIENEQLRMEFAQLQLEYESQQKEIEAMLAQEGLEDVAHSSPSEQVAYLLVERSTLLEKLEVLEQKPGSPGCVESLRMAQLQISCLKAELCKAQENKTEVTNEEPSEERQDDEEVMKTHQEKFDVLARKLSEETECRKQLGYELETKQKALKDEKKELHNSKSELLRLYSELQMLRGVAEERDFHYRACEKLQHENLLLEAKFLPTERDLQQQQKEELQQLRQDLQQLQNVCSLTEKELRFKREKNLDLKKHNILLQQENIKIKALLRQVQLKLSVSSKACSSLTSQWELSNQKVKELELELLKQSQTAKKCSSMQEELSQEKARASEVERKVSELERQLKECHTRVQLCEARNSEREQLEEDVKEARDKEEKLQRELQEERWRRKLLQQQMEQFQQQQRHSRAKETQLTELQIQNQQQETQLRILEEEKNSLSNEHLHCQKRCQTLLEQLMALREEKESLHDEFGHVLEQVDVRARKHNEQRLHRKDKLQRAKEKYASEVKLRDVRIKQLENEVKLSKSQTEKDRGLTERITAENESLLQERRKLLEQLHDLEDEQQSNKQVISTSQTRIRFLEEENSWLQDRTLQLSGQVSTLERALRNVHSHSLEEMKSVGISECQSQNRALPLPNISFSVLGLSDSLRRLKATQNSHLEETAKTPSTLQPSEIGYLNAASPGEATDFCREEQIKTSAVIVPKGARGKN